MMRFLNILPKRKPQEQQLPDPASFQNSKEIVFVNSEVQKSAAIKSATRKRGNYGEYDDEFRSKVARYAKENGIARAAQKYSKETGKPLAEQTIRNWRNSMITQESISKTNIDQIKSKTQGRPLLLGADLDKKVREYVRAMRLEGGIMNRTVLLAATRGFILHQNRSLLPEFGGKLNLTRTWADSFFKRIEFVRRKGTKAARKLPEDFDQIKANYLNKIAELVRFHDIPPQLVINWDQTGIKIVPVSEWTLAEKGSKQVDIIALEDKRQITALLASTLAGDLLPPQLLYGGKTQQCHPDFQFPADWDIWHSKNHWSNEQTMIRYVEQIIIPYVNQKRQELVIPLDQEALVIFDMYKAHQTDSLYQLLTDNKIKFVFVPASCTSELQPLDAEGSINGQLKVALKESFNLWYSEQLATQLGKTKVKKVTKIDLRLSHMKPLHAAWFLSSFDKIASNKNIVLAGWEKTGISAAVQNALTSAVSISIN